MSSATNAAVQYCWPTDPRISRLSSASRQQRDGNLGNMPSQLKLLNLFLAYNTPGNSKNPGCGATYLSSGCLWAWLLCIPVSKRIHMYVCHEVANSWSTAFQAGRNSMVFLQRYFRTEPFLKLFQNQNILTKTHCRAFFPNNSSRSKQSESQNFGEELIGKGPVPVAQHLIGCCKVWGEMKIR